RVALGEQIEDLPVVRPVAGEGDDVELALGLGGLLELFEAAEVLDRGGGGGVDAAVAARRVAALCGARGEGESGGGRQREAGDETHPAGEGCHQGFLSVSGLVGRVGI